MSFTEAPQQPKPNPFTPGGVKYLRRVQLVLSSNPTKPALDMSNMHFTFTTTQYILGTTGNTLQLRIFDLDEPTIGRIKSEFTDITLNAGYEDNPPTLFQGNIVQVRRGWDGDRSERYIDISAMDGDKQIAYNLIFAEIKAGSSYKQRWEAIANALGVPLDYNKFPTPDQLPKEVLNQKPRGLTLAGNASDAARDEAMHMMCNWSIQQGKLVVVPYKGYLSGTPVEINGANGMIGWPEQTDDGIHLQTLIDARLQVHTLIKINQADVLEAQLDMTLSKEAMEANMPGIGRALVSTDGLYYVVEVTHSGDTRGNEWYSDILCVSTAVDQVVKEEIISQGWY